MVALRHKLTFCTLCTLALGLVYCDETLQTSETHQNNQQAYNYNYNQDTSNYYTDYGYPVQQAEVPSSGFYNPLVFNQERTGLEAFLTAPLVVTAFIAALFGGFVSPLISQGLATMREFEIVLPRIRRRNETNDTMETSRMLHSLYKLYEDDDYQESPRR